MKGLDYYRKDKNTTIQIITNGRLEGGRLSDEILKGVDMFYYINSD